MTLIQNSINTEKQQTQSILALNGLQTGRVAAHAVTEA